MNELPRRRRPGLQKELLLELLLALLPTATILLVLALAAMVMLDTMHPAAVSTALRFGLRAGDENNLMLFTLTVDITVLIVVLEQAAPYVLRRNRDP